MGSLAQKLHDFKGRRVAVFGLARTGLSAARALLAAGAQVFADDDNPQGVAAAAALGAQRGSLSPEILKSCDFLLLAPGVPLHFPAPHPVVLAARAAGTEIICDIELMGRLGLRNTVIGITGTNGKSTTTAMIEHVLKSCGLEAAAGGNIGVPVFDLPLLGDGGVYVLELSSYQLDLCERFRADIAILLNVTPDHLDRHGTMENYVAAKTRIFRGAGQAIIGTDDAYSRAVADFVAARGERKVARFHVGAPEKDAAAQVNAGALYQAGEKIADLRTLLQIKGDHNYQNAAACFLACRATGAATADILEAMKDFPGLAHRQICVRKMGRVSYINDSKATNAPATEKALAAFDNIYWIAGGRPKEGGLAGLESCMPHIRKAFLIGEAAPDFAAWLSARGVAHEICFTLDRATATAHAAAQAAGQEATVLLSPACASFDQFSSYEERGNAFESLVKALS